MGTLHDLPRLLTEEEVCKALGLSVYTLRRERARRNIKAAKIGRRWKYRPEWVEAYIDRNAQCQDDSSSADTGSRDGPTAPPGAGPGLTTGVGRLAEPPLERTISRPPS